MCQIGKTLTVLTLGQSPAAGTIALTDNYLNVVIPGERLASNQWISVEVTAVSETGLIGLPTSQMPAYGFRGLSPSMITSASA
jgi:hypothetical protein